jgi:hypothetical protein
MKLFGFEIRRQSDEQEIPTFAEKVEDDGAVNLAYGGLYGTYVDLIKLLTKSLMKLL